MQDTSSRTLHLSARLVTPCVHVGFAPQVAVGPVPGVLEPKQQVQVHLTLQCLAPFTAPAALAFSYGVAGAPALSALPLRLPVAMHKFMAPEVHIPKESFFEHWRTAPPHCKAQEMVDRGATGPLSSEAVQVRQSPWQVIPGGTKNPKLPFDTSLARRHPSPCELHSNMQ